MPVPWHAHKGQERGEPSPFAFQTAALVAGDLHSLCLGSLSYNAWFHKDGDHRLLCSAAHCRLTPLETMQNNADTYSLFLFSLERWGNRADLVVLCWVQWIPKALSFTLYMLQVATPVLQGPNLLLSWVMPQIQSQFTWVLQSMSNEYFCGDIWTEHCIMTEMPGFVHLFPFNLSSPTMLKIRQSPRRVWLCHYPVGNGVT